jgi:predicted unusual protein kinase regulating ubiquinone biosynthesis (AarF/ABC1/UbiB family)
MDYIEGRNLGQVSELALIDLDRSILADELFTAYLDQIVVHGFFHADPHPGNVLVTTDGQLALIDLGMVGRIDPAMQDSLIKLLLAVSAGNGTDAAAIAVAIGAPLDDFDPVNFRRRAGRLIGRNRDATMSDLQTGALVGELTGTAAESGLRLPAELTMLGKTLLNLDAVVRILDPDFDPNAAIQRQGAELMHRKLLQSVNPANVMAAAMEAKEFAERLPGRVNKVMDALAEGRLTLNVQGIDERDIMRSVQKLANRLTAGLLVASLVIGAALIMRIPTTSTLLGYPTLAIVLFLAAAGAALVLLVTIQVTDLPQKRPRPSRRQHPPR